MSWAGAVLILAGQAALLVLVADRLRRHWDHASDISPRQPSAEACGSTWIAWCELHACSLPDGHSGDHSCGERHSGWPHPCQERLCRAEIHAHQEAAVLTTLVGSPDRWGAMVWTAAVATISFLWGYVLRALAEMRRPKSSRCGTAWDASGYKAGHECSLPRLHASAHECWCGAKSPGCPR